MKPTKFNIKKIPHGITTNFLGCIGHSGFAFGNADYQEQNKSNYYFSGDGSPTFQFPKGDEGSIHKRV